MHLGTASTIFFALNITTIISTVNKKRRSMNVINACAVVLCRPSILYTLVTRDNFTAMKIKAKGAPTIADDQNRLDVAELMFFFLICEGMYAISIIPTTRLRMM